MLSTFTEARDDILGMVKTAWATAGSYTLLYDDIKGVIPTTAVPFARAIVRHNTGRQSSLSGGLGTKKFTRQGVLSIQIFSVSGTGLQSADSLCKIMMDAFEGKASPNGVWFRNARINEIGADGFWFQTNVIIEFEYEEIK